MPPKPTCKAVLKAGQRGVRVYPKGCKVRTTVAADGTKKQVNKKGKIKRKVKVTAETAISDCTIAIIPRVPCPWCTTLVL